MMPRDSGGSEPLVIRRTWPGWAATAILVGLGAARMAVAAPMGFDDARHLLVRTGFAAREEQVRTIAGLSRQAAVDRILATRVTEAATPPPRWADDPIVPPREIKAMSEEARKAFQRERVQEALELRAWWLREMLVTPSPISERMTLFWHGHFATSQQKVKANQLMYRQNLLLRRHALGNFAVLLHAIARDPAMVVYLDSASNRKGEPNENFAREVMELFTLSEGHYTENDIKEAARAFTGWSLARETFGFRFRPMLHDDGDKTVLGRSGRFDGDQVLDILLAQPATAEFITAKLWKEFISPTPDEREVKRLAKLFRDSGYELTPLLSALLASDAFFAPANRGALVKSPVELLVGTLRQFDAEPGDLRAIAVVSAALGQNLFSPPNVKGWPGYTAWINSQTLLGRRQFLDRLFRDEQPMLPAAAAISGEQAGRAGRMLERAECMLAPLHVDADRWLANLDAEPDSLARLLLPLPPAVPPDPSLRGKALLAALVLDPAYQLK